MKILSFQKTSYIFDKTLQKKSTISNEGNSILLKSYTTSSENNNVNKKTPKIVVKHKLLRGVRCFVSSMILNSHTIKQNDNTSKRINEILNNLS